MFRFLTRWFGRKAPPAVLAGAQWTGTSYVDAYKRNRNPTPNELMAELKNTVWTCASINAGVCASYPPRLYVVNDPKGPPAKCKTRTIPTHLAERLLRRTHLQHYFTKSQWIEEVAEHPLLDLLAHVNPVHNAFDLWELTTFYQEVHGAAFWKINFDALRVPREIWILPTQNVTPRRLPDSRNLVDCYVYRSGHDEQSFDPGEIIHFRYPDPRDPYLGGLSPLRACWESAALNSEYMAMKYAKFQNSAIPDAIISPDEVVGEEERDRLEAQWNAKFRRQGSGRVVVAESSTKVQLLNHSMGDLATLAESGKTKEDIANAFHVPISFLTSNTNLANLLASQSQHMALAIDPRLRRRDEKLNEQLVPLFDPTGRLFLASEDPVPIDLDAMIAQKELDMKYGLVTINEVRSERGLPPVEWGNQPWLPLNWAPADYYRPEGLPNSGRNRQPDADAEKASRGP